jgi:hypothetical protein
MNGRLRLEQSLAAAAHAERLHLPLPRLLGARIGVRGWLSSRIAPRLVQQPPRLSQLELKGTLTLQGAAPLQLGTQAGLVEQFLQLARARLGGVCRVDPAAQLDLQ